jgi:hypothetical protein
MRRFRPFAPVERARRARGWRSGGRYLPNQDDLASVAFWYQRDPHAPFPALPSRDRLEII